MEWKSNLLNKKVFLTLILLLFFLVYANKTLLFLIPSSFIFLGILLVRKFSISDEHLKIWNTNVASIPMLQFEPMLEELWKCLIPYLISILDTIHVHPDMPEKRKNYFKIPHSNYILCCGCFFHWKQYR